jgi:hypothetical protein
MIDIVPTEYFHCVDMKMRGVFLSEESVIKEQLPMLATLPGVRARTLINNGSVIAIVGCTRVWNGVGDCWAILTDEITKTPKEFHKTVINLLDWVRLELSLHRMSASVKSDYTVGKKWVEALGFEKEATLKRLGPDGSDYDVYVRFY